MRSYIVFALLVLMIAGFVTLLVMRERPEHEVQLTAISESDGGEVAGDPAANDAGESETSSIAEPDGRGDASAGGSPAASGDGGSAGDGEAGPAKLMDRPLRVVGLGWDVLAPGLVSNRGTEPGDGSHFMAERLEVRFAVARTPEDLERALASGGADADGADVAVLPLPTLVASAERLRALSPEVVLVVGWSRGRETLLASAEDALTSLPRSGGVPVATEARSPSAFFATFLLDLAGVSPGRMQLIPIRDNEAASATFSAVQRGGAAALGDDTRRLLLTTADATRLVPYVVVAPRGFVAGHAEALRAWARAWFQGVSELGRDVPAAARRISALQGAPEALALLERLGQIEPSSLRDNAQAAGLSGRDAVTLETLYRHIWRLLRDGDVLSTPCPAQVPVSTVVIEDLVRTASSVGDSGATDATPAAGDSTTPSRRPETLLVWSSGTERVSHDDLVSTVGFIAGVFRPLPIRVVVRGDRPETEAVIGAARERFALPESRLVAGRRPAGRGTATIEVLSAQ